MAIFNHDLPIVQAGPRPTASISETATPLEIAENVYWIRYLLAITSRLPWGRTSEQYEFMPVMASKIPAPTRNAVIAGTTSFTREQYMQSIPQPNPKYALGIIIKNENIPARNRSSGNLSPFLFSIQRLTVVSDRRPPAIVPTTNPAAGAR